MQYVDSLLDLIGNTPLVRLSRTLDLPATGGPLVLAKVEYLNPGGSVKDRIAVRMVEAAEAAGELKLGGDAVPAPEVDFGAAFKSKSSYLSTASVGNYVFTRQTGPGGLPILNFVDADLTPARLATPCRCPPTDSPMAPPAQHLRLAHCR